MSQPNHASRVASSSNRPLLEGLEGRRLLTVTTVTGTNGNDVFQLTHLNAGDQVVYNGKGGHDEIKIVTNGSAESVLGLVTLKSTGGGTFYVDVDDRAAIRDHDLKVGKGKIVDAVSGVVDYSQTHLSMLSVYAQAKTTSTAVAFDTAAGVKNFFDLQGKWDVTLGGETSTVASLKGIASFTADKGSGSVMHILDSADTAPRTIETFGDGMNGLAPGTLGFGGFDQVHIAAGSGNKTVTIGRTYGDFRFLSAGGHDDVTLGYAGRLDAVRPGLTVGNFYGKTSLKIDDSAQTAAGSFVVKPTGVAFASGDVAFAGDTTVSILTGKGDDVVYVNGTNANAFSLKTGAGQDDVTLVAAGGSVSVDTGGDTDALRIGKPGAGNLTGFAKGLSAVNAEAVRVSDQGQSWGFHYAVSSTGVVRDYTQAFKFSGAKSISLSAGTGNDDIDAFAVGSSTTVALSGGAGTDKLYGHSGADSLVGGDGDDTLIGAGGKDSVYGNAGDDVLDVAGDDNGTIADGGSGTDSARYDGGNLPVFCEHTIKTVTATGTVYADANGNGVRDSGETGKAGVQLWADQNGNGVWDSGDLSVTTDAGGHYTMRDLNYGFIYMHVQPPVGTHQTNNGGQAIYFGAPQGSTKTGVDFGLHANA